ncbi:MAG: peptidase T [Oscillospiraceae bacterium]|nr:peptidase T [Oscillospiraceae bacterium]
MTLQERFISYVQVHTSSSEAGTTVPSTERQFDLSRKLEQELKQIGMQNVFTDEHAYVYAELPASGEGFEKQESIAFIAHLDTIPDEDFSGKDVKPQIICNYNGGDVALGSSGRVLSPERFTHLKNLAGQTLITTDGTTVLGADDKAGIAEIVTACDEIIRSKKEHRRIAVCFTPDEEIGHGAELLDLQRLKADYAFTVDGGEANDINYETFNAASARITVAGSNIHPGSAKNQMKNASLIAMELNAMLPAAETPAHTENYEGFYHLISMKGSVEQAELNYIIRDHVFSLLEHRVEALQHAAAILNEQYGPDTVKVEIRYQYRNMAEKLSARMDIIDRAKKAVETAGLTPVTTPIRGGTDGSQLTYRGLLCPNLGTGGYCCHGPYEHVTVEAMETVKDIIKNLVYMEE